MSDARLPRDELVSAYVDGALAPDDRAIVEADPALMADVEIQRAIADALAAPRTSPAALRDVHVAAALEEFDTKSSIAAAPADPTQANPTGADSTSRAKRGSPDIPAGSDTVVDFAEQRSKRRPLVRRGTVIAAAVAIVFVVFAAIGLSGGSDTDLADSTVQASFETSDASSDVASVDASTDASSLDNGNISSSSDSNSSDMSESDAMDDDSAMDDSDMSESDMSESDMEESDLPKITQADPFEPSSDEMSEDLDADSEAPALVPEPTNAQTNAGGGNIGTTAADDAAAEAASTFESDSAPTDLGQFDDTAALIDAVKLLPVTEPDLPLGPSCQNALDQLSIDELTTIYARATIATTPVEVHRLPGTSDSLIVESDTCLIVTTFED